MSTRMMLTIEKILPDEDGPRQMEELRAFLSARGWEVLAEEGDFRGEERLDIPPIPPAQPVPARLSGDFMDTCPHCRGPGRVAGAGACGLCHGQGRVPAGTRHLGRCCE